MGRNYQSLVLFIQLFKNTAKNQNFSRFFYNFTLKIVKIKLEDPLQIEFQCRIKQIETISSDMEIEKEENGDEKNFAQSNVLLSLIKALEVKDISPENSKENLAKYSLVQMIQFLCLINTNNFFEDIFNSPFYTAFMEMKNDPFYSELIQSSFLGAKLSLHNLKNPVIYINKKISQNLARKLKVN